MVAPKPEATLNPAGTVMAPKVRLALPSLYTWNVCVTGAPGSVLPNLTWLVPSLSAAWLYITRVCGPVSGAPRYSTRMASAIR